MIADRIEQTVDKNSSSKVLMKSVFQANNKPFIMYREPCVFATNT